MNRRNKKTFIRSGFILGAVAVICTGILPLLSKEDLFYSNWWGGLVFAPLTLMVGCFLLYLVIFKWEIIEKGLSSKK